MNYQSDSQINRPHRLIIAKPQDYQPSQQRSSSGKKVFIIRRKISTSPSTINKDYSKQKSQIKTNENSNLKIGSNHLQRQKQLSSLVNAQNSPQLPETRNKIISNPQNSRENSYQAMHLSVKQSRKEGHPSLQVSRGQQYENELDMIQKDVQFFRFELQMAKNKKTQLENVLLTKKQQIQCSIQNIYTCFNKTFSNQSTTMSVLDKCFPSLLDKRNFKLLINKINTKQIEQISLSQIQIDMRFVFKSLQLAFEAIQEGQQKLDQMNVRVEQDQNRVKDYANQIKLLGQQNHKLKISNKQLRQEILLNQEQKKVLISQHQQQTALLLTKSYETIKKDIQKQQKPQIDKRTLHKNAQVQTEQKRIGSAASINKYRSHHRLATSTINRQSPYRHYTFTRSNDGSLSSSKQMHATSISKIRQQQLQQQKQQQPQVQTVKKAKFLPIVIKDKKNNNVNVIVAQNTNNNKKLKQSNKNKKPTIKTSSYLNHLIQSQTILKGDETVETIQFDKKQQSQIQKKQTSNAKSILKIRRPIHRSRSHSHQQLSSSKEKFSMNVSINNISSRVYSTYSLNPLNKYGEKRLCNQSNSKKVRKITQLSQESQELQQRMKQLMQEEKALMDKYKHLEKVKVSRENKKSRQNKTSLENSRKKI